MKTFPRSSRPCGTRERGMTMVELLVVLGLVSAVTLMISMILMSSSRVESRTMRRAEVQGDSRQALSLMTAEIRQVGLDPNNPPTGAFGIIAADTQSIRVRADLNADGVISTAEPSEDIIYAYDAVARALTRNPGGGATPVLGNVTAMALTYFDEANAPITTVPLSIADAARVRSIGLTLTCVDRDSQPITLTTRIALRNL